MTVNIHDAVSPFAGSPIATKGGLIPDGMYPSGFSMRVIRDASVVAHGSTMEYFDAMLSSHATVYEWAASHPARRELQGRMTAYAVPLPYDEEVSVVVRHAHHGGLLASVTNDVFRVPRAADELRISWTLRHVGIPTPRVLGFVLYPVMYGQFWRADVVTREIVGSRDLASILSDDSNPAEHDRAIETTIVLLRKLARTWAFHADLNVKNILIATEVDEPAEEPAPPPPPPPVEAKKPSAPPSSSRKIPSPVSVKKGATPPSTPTTSDADESTEETARATTAKATPSRTEPATADNIRQLAYVLDVDTLRFAEKKAEWMNVARLLRSAKKWQEQQPHPGFAKLIERLGG